MNPKVELALLKATIENYKKRHDYPMDWADAEAKAKGLSMPFTESYENKVVK